MYTIQDWEAATAAYEIIIMAQGILSPKANSDMFVRATDRIFSGIEFGDEPEQVYKDIKGIFNDAVAATLGDDQNDN
jgi:hypothetical protein